MAVKIRLTRKGRKKKPVYRVVVADERFCRDGKFIEVLGQYDPRVSPKKFDVNRERVQYWLDQGAQASDTVRRLYQSSQSVSSQTAKA